MKVKNLLPIAAIALASCTQKPAESTHSEARSASPMVGTWKLVSAITVTKGYTVKDYPVPNQGMLKILNDTHFAFMRHDLSKGKGKDATYTAGGALMILKAISIPSIWPT